MLTNRLASRFAEAQTVEDAAMRTNLDIVQFGRWMQVTTVQGAEEGNLIALECVGGALSFDQQTISVLHVLAEFDVHNHVVRPIKLGLT